MQGAVVTASDAGNAAGPPQDAAPTGRVKVAPGFTLDREELVRLGGTLAVIVVMIVAFSIAQPRFMSVLNWQNIAIEMSVLLVIGIAGTFPIMIGSIDLSVGSIATLCGIFTAMSLRDGGVLDTAGALPIALLVGLAAGVMNGLLFGLLGIPSFLVTLGTFFALDGLASWIVHGTPIPIVTTGPSNTFDGQLGVAPDDLPLGDGGPYRGGAVRPLHAPGTPPLCGWRLGASGADRRRPRHAGQGDGVRSLRPAGRIRWLPAERPPHVGIAAAGRGPPAAVDRRDRDRRHRAERRGRRSRSGRSWACSCSRC